MFDVQIGRRGLLPSSCASMTDITPHRLLSYLTNVTGMLQRLAPWGLQDGLHRRTARLRRYAYGPDWASLDHVQEKGTSPVGETPAVCDKLEAARKVRFASRPAGQGRSLPEAGASAGDSFRLLFRTHEIVKQRDVTEL